MTELDRLRQQLQSYQYADHLSADDQAEISRLRARIAELEPRLPPVVSRHRRNFKTLASALWQIRMVFGPMRRCGFFCDGKAGFTGKILNDDYKGVMRW